MSSFRDFYERISRLQDASARLLQSIVAWSDDVDGRPISEADFFDKVKEQLDGICEAIARIIGADNCVLFFIEDEPEGDCCMVMRGAWGNFTKTCEAGRAAAAGKEPLGYRYPSLLHEAEGKPDDKIREIIRGWPVTNQIWHLGTGRMANSNRAMDVLSRAHYGKRKGKGDNLNYPNNGNLWTVYRNMVAVPIFARGGRPQLLADPFEKDDVFGSLQNRGEFAAQYRVIGILKVENKKPIRAQSDLPRAGELFSDRLGASSRERLRKWIGPTMSAKRVAALRDQFIRPAARQPSFNYAALRLLNEMVKRTRNKASGEFEYERSGLDVELIDHLTETFEAEFTQADVELLVTIAMQLGRMLMRRTIEHAASHDLILSEHEAGVLNMRYSDVVQLKSYIRACDRLRRGVHQLLDDLRIELTEEVQEEVFEAQVTHRIQPRKPIRHVLSRTKEPISLFRKLVRKEEEFDRHTSIVKSGGLWQRQTSYQHLRIHKSSLRVENFDALDERQAVVRGPMRLFWRRKSHGGVEAHADGELGTPEGPRAVFEPPACDTMLDASLKDIPVERNADWSLVQRILSDYDVDDVAGVRVVCDYVGDLDHVVDEIRARCPEWEIQVTRIDPALDEGKEGGYRAVHITVEADVAHVIGPEDTRNIRRALALEPHQKILLPCEIQLRTTLQDAEALKSHALYKGETEGVDHSYFDLLRTQTDQLHKVETTSDLIRGQVEEILMPADYGERRLLADLRKILTREGFALVEFGLACAKQIHQDDLRLNGSPYLSYLLAVCSRLVTTFGVDDPEMLLLALLHDLWKKTTKKMRRLLKDVDLQDYGDAHFNEDLAEGMRRKPGHRLKKLVKRFEGRVSWDERLAGFQNWFWVLLGGFRQFWRDYHEKRPDELADARWKRIYDIRKHLEKEVRRRGSGETREKDREDWLLRAFVLEAAILLGRLEELPHESNRKRAEEQFRNAYRELELIVDNLPPLPIKRKVVEETTKVFREIAERMEVEIPINWYR